MAYRRRSEAGTTSAGEPVHEALLSTMCVAQLTVCRVLSDGMCAEPTVTAMEAQALRATLPALRHDVQTLSRFGVTPSTRVRTRWMLGFQRRFVRRCECEMLCPKLGLLPQTSQVAATGLS